jgi:hypothetical protein
MTARDTVGVADHDRFRRRIGKIHALKSGRIPTAKRNRSKYETACGRAVLTGLPIRTTEAPDALCGHCYRDVR